MPKRHSSKKWGNGETCLRVPHPTSRVPVSFLNRIVFTFSSEVACGWLPASPQAVWGWCSCVYQLVLIACTCSSQVRAVIERTFEHVPHWVVHVYPYAVRPSVGA